MSIEPQSVLGIAIAALGGAAVGLEREWSGHARGPEAHFAGIRTFTLLGGLAGVAGWLWSVGLQPAMGIFSNTILKLLLGISLGRGRFRVLAPAWLAVMAIATGASIAVLR
jgi:hypothetical protein